MAPNGEILAKPFSKSGFVMPPPRLSTEGLQRAMSDLSFALSKEEILDAAAAAAALPPISEVEDAKCECCGMSEECTPDYIRRVREKYSGKWICGLCSEAVKEEVEKNGGRKEEALDAHMSACVRFNKFGRTHPVLYQAEAMREILRRNSKGVRAKSSSPRDHKGSVIKKGGIARSSSCIPAITKEIQELTAQKY
ncbi:uncharacterized protein M6B38_317725 [Iris pallida]|uniref:DUF1677 family protein n=1 Tax=Iris pallida TaxID=29817 RepID=A0AAX6HES9_IRIPA|nr:uncharacterized protein M6B38_317720 [Iris pallida]KAJ6838926.1 uncharacterized protein M6B38_317725 [Iris pallida]